MPDHFHAIITLPADDTDYSKRFAWIKRTFTVGWLDVGGAEQAVTEAQHVQRRRGVWQPRDLRVRLRESRPTDMQ